MSLRAVVIGLIAAMLLSVVDAFAGVHGLGVLVADLAPPMAFTFLLALALIVNPVAGWLRPRWRLRTTELATVLVMMLAGAGVSYVSTTSGIASLAMPHYYSFLSPAMRKADLLSQIPQGLIPQADAYEGLLQGLGNGQDMLSPGAVPWGTWRAPLLMWLPLMVLTGLGLFCLAVVLHRQWSVNERLRYPVAELAVSLIGGSPQQPEPVWRQRLFWLAVAAVAGVHAVNLIDSGLKIGISVPMELDFSALRDRFPSIISVPFSMRTFRPGLFPVAIGLGFLLARDVSFTAGIAPIAYLAAALIMYVMGVESRESAVMGGTMTWMRFGAFLAYAGSLVYLGRRYYWQTFRRAIGGRQEADASAVWALRGFLIAAAALAVLLNAWGLSWPLALLLVGLIVLMYVVVARMNVECGLFLVVPRWMPVGILAAAVGSSALGPRAIMLTGLVSVVLLSDPRAALLPFIANGLKIAQSCQVSPPRLGRWMAGGFVACLLVAVPASLWASYDHGLQRIDQPVRQVLDAAAEASRDLESAGAAGQSVIQTAGVSWGIARPNRTFITAAGVGALLVTVLAAVRLRLIWWPVHPVLLLIFGTWAASKYGFSFLVGWAVKTAVVKLGTPRTVQAARTLMLGMLTGQLLSGGLLHIALILRYLYTHLTPPSYPGGF